MSGLRHQRRGPNGRREHGVVTLGQCGELHEMCDGAEDRKMPTMEMSRILFGKFVFVSTQSIDMKWTREVNAWPLGSYL